MIDLIIPTYKDIEGLKKSLSSIDPTIFSITVIDDYSNLYYNKVLEEFPYFQIFYNQENIGPGNTRQLGIEITKNPYIMFLDSGDYFLNKEIQSTIPKTIEKNPECVLFSWQYKKGNKLSLKTSNHLHGRVYKREFIEQHNINFCAESSYVDEDIGFNRLYRLLMRNENLEMLYFEEPAVFYDLNENSLTNKNNGEFFYKQQNIGLALNGIHEIESAEKNNVKKSLIIEEINSLMSSMYYTFLCTQYERPEFEKDALEGAQLFYNKCFLPYLQYNNSAALTTAYSVYVKRIYSRAKTWKNFKPLNFNNFLRKLKEYNN